MKKEKGRAKKSRAEKKRIEKEKKGKERKAPSLLVRVIRTGEKNDIHN